MFKPRVGKVNYVTVDFYCNYQFLIIINKILLFLNFFLKKNPRNLNFSSLINFAVKTKTEIAVEQQEEQRATGDLKSE